MKKTNFINALLSLGLLAGFIGTSHAAPAAPAKCSLIVINNLRPGTQPVVLQGPQGAFRVASGGRALLTADCDAIANIQANVKGPLQFTTLVPKQRFQLVVVAPTKKLPANPAATVSHTIGKGKASQINVQMPGEICGPGTACFK